MTLSGWLGAVCEVQHMSVVAPANTQLSQVWVGVEVFGHGTHHYMWWHSPCWSTLSPCWTVIVPYWQMLSLTPPTKPSLHFYCSNNNNLSAFLVHQVKLWVMLWILNLRHLKAVEWSGFHWLFLSYFLFLSSHDILYPSPPFLSSDSKTMFATLMEAWKHRPQAFEVAERIHPLLLSSFSS